MTNCEKDLTDEEKCLNSHCLHYVDISCCNSKKQQYDILYVYTT